MPDAPTDVTVLAGEGSLKISWLAPVNVGATPITFYTATARVDGVDADDEAEVQATASSTPDADGLTCIARTETSCTIAKLKADTEYTVTVTATNSIGTSLPSVRSKSISPKLVPGVPTAPRITEVVARDGEVEVSVVAARKGNRTLEFTVKASPGGETCSFKTDDSSCFVEDLINGHEYRFTAVASNDLGDSLPSAASDAVSPQENPDLPSPPIVDSVTVGNGKAEVHVSGGPGPAVTLFTLTAIPGGSECSTDTGKCTFSELSNGTSYTFTAKSINRAGHSRSSAPSIAGTPTEESELPGAPNIDSVNLGNQSATIELLPGTAGGAPKSYTVTASPGGQSCSTSGTSCTVSGLNDSTAYTFTATATNKAGKSETSRQAAAPAPVATAKAS